MHIHASQKTEFVLGRRGKIKTRNPQNDQDVIRVSHLTLPKTRIHVLRDGNMIDLERQTLGDLSTCTIDMYPSA